MSIPSDCCTPCSTTQLNSVPGAEGDPGINAYSIVSGAVAVPALGADTGAITVDTTEWMVVGMYVVLGQGQTALANPGPIFCKVKTIVNATQVILTCIGYAAAVAPATPISDGAYISPSGSMSVYPYSVYASGTVATVPDDGGLVLLNFGTQDPSLTIPVAGTYLLLARVSYRYSSFQPTGAQYVTTRLFVFGGAEVPGTNVVHYMRKPVDATDQSAGAVEQTLPPVVYVATAGDRIDMQAAVNTAVTGDLTATYASIIAVRLY